MKPMVRQYEEQDIPSLIVMMRDLARFEKYIDEFAVTEDFLRNELQNTEDSDIGIIVAEQVGELLGYATYFSIKFTYTLKPTMVLKELYVSPSNRGRSVGHHLFDEIQEVALRKGAAKLAWSVMPSNAHAKQFYSCRGGAYDPQWENWSLVF